jgi:hypothetical protein
VPETPPQDEPIAIRCGNCQNRTGLNQAVLGADGVVFCRRCGLVREILPTPGGDVELVGS